jgi:hypothetical protein
MSNCVCAPNAGSGRLRNAINHAGRRMIELEIARLFLPWFESFRCLKGEFTFGRYGNVITNVRFEHMLSAAGL